ncbi:MAG: anaerobic benzoate catabolism transcriptional regulator [bacterium ADurb.Bin243]|nr:MAG: anaerobic benzoate catabolism transcriptional regulator [bacterium ADurb.Bin243]HOD39837.1 helix-turn-helix transcriptional regulator [Candidatus Wallbacteria bacterium]
MNFKEDAIYKHIGNLIYKIRKDLKITQEALAKKVDLTRASITQIENGRQKLPIFQLYKISEVFGVSIYELLPDNKKVSSESKLDKLSLKRVGKEKESIMKIIEEDNND